MIKCLISNNSFMVNVMKILRNLIAIALIASTLAGCVTTAVLTEGGNNRRQEIGRQIGI